MKNISQMKSNLCNVVLILFLGINFSCSVTKSKRTEVISEKADPLYIEIDRLGKELTVKNNVPGIAVAVIKNGKLAWIQTIGYADLASKKTRNI